MGAADHSDESAASQTIRRSRRNHDRCLRTKRRVATTVSAAARSRSPSSSARTCWYPNARAAVGPSRRPGSRLRVSATSPAANMRATRRAMRSSSSAVGRSTPSSTAS
jgi:hypothetical protein